MNKIKSRLDRVDADITSIIRFQSDGGMAAHTEMNETKKAIQVFFFFFFGPLL